jgi:hypothetical protein
MARPLSTTIPNHALSPEEEKARLAFKRALINDYQIKDKSDLTLLDLGSYEYIKARRLQEQEISTGVIRGNIRYHPLSELRGLLSMMSATRTAKLRGGKQPENSTDADMRDLLMGLSADDIGQNRSHNHEQ